MRGNGSGTKTSNFESYARWPTQRFERIAHAGRLVTIRYGAPFGEFWPVFRASDAFILANPLVSRQWAGGQFHERYRRVLTVPFGVSG
jgi:hypothetical protein